MTATLYESPALRAVTGPAIRPGGYTLTDKGVAACGLVKGARVLDVGCGTGATVDHLRRRHGLTAAGLDLSAALLKDAGQAHDGLPLVQGRAQQIPAADGAFSAVLCECVLSLCPDPLIVLREIRRVLQPGGAVVVTDVYAPIPEETPWPGEMPVHCCLRGAVDSETVKRRIHSAGFTMVLWEDHTPLLKRLAAQLVWAYGSLDAFWTAAAGADGVKAAAHRDGGMGCRRPGYYLLVARTLVH